MLGKRQDKIIDATACFIGYMLGREGRVNVMESNNAAYTKEYEEYKKKFDYIFCDKYKDKDEEEESIALSDGKHSIRIHYYHDESYEFSRYNIYASMTEVFDDKMNKVAVYKNIDHHVALHSVVKHSNGNSYLFFNTQLYGYSVMNLSKYKVYHYIPESSFKNGEETFIWTDVYYCRKNNMIAVEGCYWAASSGTEIFDFSEPETLPLKRLLSSYDMMDELNIYSDVTPLRWNEDGTIVFKCCDMDSDEEVEKVVDVATRIKGGNL